MASRCSARYSSELEPNRDPDDPAAHLARRRRPPPPNAGLLDVRPRGRADALPGERLAAARLDAASHAPDSRLVRVLDRVRAGARWRRLVATRADLGAGSDRDPAAAVGARRAVLEKRDVILR